MTEDPVKRPQAPIVRRQFLKGATAFIPQAAAAQESHDHQQDHDHQVVPSDIALRVKALESLLIEKGMVNPAALDAVVDAYERKIGPRNGGRVVARAWKDSAYRQRLLADGTAAITELGYGGSQGEHMVVLENTPGSITSWSARYVRATHGLYWACRLSGTSRRRTARGQ
jgi:hypothetical protein